MKNVNFRKEPLYQKAEEILQMVHRIVDLIPEDDEMLKSTGGFMMDDALRLPAKIAGAMGADLYDLQMENAAIIRKSARDIYVSCNHFFAANFKETEYLHLLRETIEEFRILFAEWVKTFDPWNYIIDRWGLFNPPGVNYDDKDPDDDIPFDNPFNTDDPE
ncbi:hypothetical protein SAMN05444483_101268 [Salegentibacter echinorum]|uniref:Four helix bundle protein n=1 Tax=Salegentibacter echinorum TaxID=1073325 RepID=A0A1M5BZW9_SALEC|nr:hypothetical protein [Salegentibacter echinorum]SHF47991.1 hypothetical protein SAMN05444483_101268 [Salegentibacter echinorum]